MTILNDNPAAARAQTAGAPAVRSSRLIHLDVLRGVAILLVLGAHIMFRLPDETFARLLFHVWHQGGWIGVDLFFVLSGFLIGGLLFAEQAKYQNIHFGRFLIRRTFKIWPAYLVFLAGGFVYGVWLVPHQAKSLAGKIGETARAMWVYPVHLQNYIKTPMVGYIGHAWSLAVEEHFYLLLPLLLMGLGWFAKRNSRSTPPPPAHARVPYPSLPWIGVALMVICLSLRCLAWYRTNGFDEFVHHLPTHMRIDSLFLGVILAHTVQFRRSRIESLRPWRKWLLAASLLCFVPFTFETYDVGFSYTIGYTILAIGSAGLVICAWLASVPAEPGLTKPPLLTGLPASALKMVIVIMAWVGERSYSIYLWHRPFTWTIVTKFQSHVGTLFHLWGTPWIFPLTFVFDLVFCIALGAVMFRAVELPWVAWRDRRFPSRSRFEALRRHKTAPLLHRDGSAR